MKKLLALVAIVAMVAVSSMAYAASDSVTITGSVTSSWSVTGCPASLSGINPSTEVSGSCNVAIVSNEATGYDINYGDADTNNELISTSTAADTIVALDDDATASCATNTECWSFRLGTIADGTAQADTDHVTPSLAFGTGEHTVETTTDFATGENVLDSASTSFAGNLQFTFYADGVNTTASHADYTDVTTVTIL